MFTISIHIMPICATGTHDRHLCIIIIPVSDCSYDLVVGRNEIIISFSANKMS